jgi:GntR family histidine utilization transcriptional repressor
LLGINLNDPCLIVVRRTVNTEGPITLARLVHPGARYQIHGQFKP